MALALDEDGLPGGPPTAVSGLLPCSPPAAGLSEVMLGAGELGSGNGAAFAENGELGAVVDVGVSCPAAAAAVTAAEAAPGVEARVMPTPLTKEGRARTEAVLLVGALNVPAVGNFGEAVVLAALAAGVVGELAALPPLPLCSECCDDC